MKLNIKTATFALAAAFAMVSCSEGKYWDGVKDPSDVFAFAKTSETVMVGATEEFPTEYSIKVRRTTKGAEQTVPVELETNTNLISGPATVTFPAGSDEATYTFSIARGGAGGVSYMAQVTLPTVENSNIKEVEDNRVFLFTVRQALNWVDAGMATVSSKFFESVEDVHVQVATNYAKKNVKYCRLVEPYYILAPEEVEPGANIEFTLDADDEAMSMPNWQYIGFLIPEEGYGYFYFGCPAQYDGAFISQGDMFQMSGVLGTAGTLDAADDDVEPGWYEILTFQWPDYDKPLEDYGK